MRASCLLWVFVAIGLAGLTILTAANQPSTAQQAPFFLSITNSWPDIRINMNDGMVNTYYVLEATGDLTSTNWTAIRTNFTDTTGTFFYIDKNALILYPQRFYRAHPLN